MQAFAANPLVHRIPAAEAWAAHPKPRGAAAVPPVVRLPDGTVSIYYNWEGPYADAVSSTGLRYRPSAYDRTTRVLDDTTTATLIARLPSGYHRASVTVAKAAGDYVLTVAPG